MEKLYPHTFSLFLFSIINIFNLYFIRNFSLIKFMYLNGMGIATIFCCNFSGETHFHNDNFKREVKHLQILRKKLGWLGSETINYSN